MDRDKLAEIEALLSSIREKTVCIRTKTESLARVNTRLEAFRAALDAYALEGTEAKTGKEPRGSPRKRTRVEKEAPGAAAPAVHSEDTVALLFATNRAHRHTALQIYRLVRESGVVGLDDIVRSIRLSKYRLIEILNVLVRERVVLKYFDKGFMYKVNGEP